MTRRRALACIPQGRVGVSASSDVSRSAEQAPIPTNPGPGAGVTVSD